MNYRKTASAASPDTLEIRIPFEGFYSSIHDDALDRALESINTDDSGNDFERISSNNVDWRPIHLAYAQAYLKEVADLLPCSMSFSRLTSPKFYNFETDQIFAQIPRDDIEALLGAVTADPARAEAFRAHVQETLQPRSGFCPYYPDDLEEWGALETWTEAQISVLIDFAAIEADLDQALIAEGLHEKVENLIWASVIDESKVREPEAVIDAPGL